MSTQSATPRNVGWALTARRQVCGYVVIAGRGLNRTWWQGPESVAGRVWDREMNRWTGWWPTADQANRALRKVYGAQPPPCEVVAVTEAQADRIRWRMEQAPSRRPW